LKKQLGFLLRMLFVVFLSLIVPFSTVLSTANGNNENNGGNVLKFLLLGDWGKGGRDGQTFGEGNKKNRRAASIDDEKSQHQISLDSNKEVQRGNEVFYQYALAKSMGNYSRETDPRPSFVLALGDNFYNDGVSSKNDSMWNELWKDVYFKEYPELYIPWYPVFGNHDYGGGSSAVVAQLERFYDHEDDDVWIFPSTNYTKSFPIPNSYGRVDVIFVDTTTLAPSENECCDYRG
jgi:hypothetical protein